MTKGRIITALSALHGPNHTRYIVLLDEREIAYAEVPRETSKVRVLELLVRQLTVQAFQGMPDLPPGWLGLLPDSIGPTVRNAVKLELMAMRASVYMLEHGLGIEPTTGIGVPVPAWAPPAVTCAVALTDEEAAARKAFVITDRAQLITDPTPQDSCTDYTTEPQARDCNDDGHYLCEGCGRFDRERRARDFDVDDQVKS